MYYYKQVCIDPICPWVFAYACVYLHHRFLKVNWIFWATDVWDLNSKVVSINIHVHSCKTHVSFKKKFIVIFYLFYLKGWVTEGERFSVHWFIVQMVTIPWAEKPGWSEEPGTPSVFPMWAAGIWALPWPSFTVLPDRVKGTESEAEASGLEQLLYWGSQCDM